MSRLIKAAVPRGLLIGAFSLPPLLLSCRGGAPYKPPVYTLSVSPQPATVAAGSTVTFTATTNAPTATWGLIGLPNGPTPSTIAGTPTEGNGNTFVYTAPATPPIYNAVAPQAPGTVTLRAVALGDPTMVQFTFTITAPSITTGFIPPLSTSVGLGATQSIGAYAVGSANNAITLQVNGVTGGSASVGTIAPLTNGFYGEYVYTAPAIMPITGSTINITAISQADPTKSSNLALTLH